MMLEIIEPLVLEIYGDNVMSRGLVNHLIYLLEGEGKTPLYRWEEREDRIRLACWDWMTGGSTAEYAARRIETALQKADL